MLHAGSCENSSGNGTIKPWSTFNSWHTVRSNSS